MLNLPPQNAWVIYKMYRPPLAALALSNVVFREADATKHFNCSESVRLIDFYKNDNKHISLPAAGRSDFFGIYPIVPIHMFVDGAANSAIMYSPNYHQLKVIPKIMTFNDKQYDVNLFVFNKAD